ncbi:hypothetical protein JTB14_022653 [Gonioctena quinquepunctata]|nr:hypothetical protein JTB14_022653 [Gonioctena quinquepunctata]
MDVLVRWRDGTKNIVSSSELEITSRILKVGSKVKMLYRKKWYSGVVIDMEDNVAAEWSSEDDVPLTNFSNVLINSKTLLHYNIGFRKEISFNDLKNNKDTTNQIGISSAGAETMMESKPIPVIEITDDFVVEAIDAEHNETVSPSHSIDMSLSDPFSGYDSDADPPYRATCEVYECKREVFSSCHRCLILLSFDHFENCYDSCNDHSSKKARHNKISLNESTNDTNKKRENNVSERYAVERSEKEATLIKVPRVNKQKVAKSLKSMGKQYCSTKTKKIVPPKFLKKRCNGGTCRRQGGMCSLFTDENRGKLFEAYNEIGNLFNQREFIVRHTKVDTTKQKTSNKDQSRRQNTIFNYLTRNNEKVLVCKKFFLGTLGISERTMRTALKKVNASGTVELDKRGGRQSQEVKKRDFTIHEAIEKHINEFPKIESHYCRAKSTREYLHPDLTISKMYSLFLEEQNKVNGKKLSKTTYQNIFRSKNLSFHKPKKDQCSLCITFKDGDDNTKLKLKDIYDKHNAGKIKVRELKNECKTRATIDKKIVCGSFDLQQGLHLPVSNESAIFYKRRLSNYNSTYYDIVTKACKCFTWHEGISKRGSCEIATCIYRVLQSYDNNNVQFVSLYSDGCGGQNKNSIVAAMLLLAVVQSRNIESITLRYFESYHGQNEHSCISNAVSHAGDLFVPTQLHTIFKLARRQRPYDVFPLGFEDFIDFKKLSLDLRILKSRETDDAIK